MVAKSGNQPSPVELATLDGIHGVSSRSTVHKVNSADLMGKDMGRTWEGHGKDMGGLKKGGSDLSRDAFFKPLGKHMASANWSKATVLGRTWSVGQSAVYYDSRPKKKVR